MAKEMGNLIVSRRIGEPLYIGDDIVITVLSQHGRESRLSIECPKSIKILRHDAKDRTPKER